MKKILAILAACFLASNAFSINIPLDQDPTAGTAGTIGGDIVVEVGDLWSLDVWVSSWQGVEGADDIIDRADIGLDADTGRFDIDFGTVVMTTAAIFFDAQDINGDGDIDVKMWDHDDDPETDEVPLLDDDGNEIPSEGYAYRAGDRYTAVTFYVGNNLVDSWHVSGVATGTVFGITPADGNTDNSVIHAVNVASIDSSNGTTLTANLNQEGVKLPIQSGEAYNIYADANDNTPVSDNFTTMLFLDYLPVSFDPALVAGSFDFTLVVDSVD